MVKNGGLKKSISVWPFWRFDNLLLFGKTRSHGGRSYQIEKKAFLNSLLMKKHNFWHVQWFLNGQKWGVKKASLYDHFEGLTTDSYLANSRPPGGRSDRKKGFFNPLLMRKHNFWHVQWFLNGQKWGVK